MSEEFVLGVDLDGVCADHAEAFRRVVAVERGSDAGELGPQTTWDFAEWGRDRPAIFATVVSALAVVLCFGSQTPLYAAYRALPLGATFRLPDRFVFLLSFGLSLLTASGFDRVFAARGARAIEGQLARDHRLQGKIGLGCQVAYHGQRPTLAQASDCHLKRE